MENIIDRESESADHPDISLPSPPYLPYIGMGRGMGCSSLSELFQATPYSFV